jgi:flagellar hook-associated protein 3 FlgL
MDRQLDLKTQLSQIRDLDYADAITTLNIQLAGLQAAQQSYAKISNLNLFNYL